MDIFAHTLWAAAGAREANELAEKKNSGFRISLAWTAFFGVFPDLFAFTIPIALKLYYFLSGSILFPNFFQHPSLSSVAEGGGVQNGFGIAYNLYQYSHSLVIWVVVFLMVWAFYKRPRYELFGWALHILLDIPSHVLAFFPTPFLFPISDYKFPYGVQWSNGYFMIVNYGLLLLVWGRMLLLDLRAKYAAK